MDTQGLTGYAWSDETFALGKWSDVASTLHLPHLVHAATCSMHPVSQR